MFSKETYIQRREALMREVNNGVIVLFGNAEVPYNYPDNTYHFRQDSTFRYYFGLDVPMMVGLMDTYTHETFLFADDVDIDDIIWTGPMPSVKDMA
ncbi:MAG: aminopeptidase P N-terminal domain-containing protein, partial [Bacteroidaceae bacterium]|nr:aminopeptidase P N-terminal domain-containing protein [Bacteroidaceae bacterium]